jgi:CRP/FNR family cyclic AMP-dependent transcriptional regulator
MNTNMKTCPPLPGADAGVPREDLAMHITRHPFMADLSPHQRRLLADCAMLIQFKPGELIFREGDPANRFYLVQRGSVALEARAGLQTVTRIDTVGAGDVLGWSWLFPPYFWHFDARALEPTEAIFLYGTPLREECDRDHDLGYEFVRRMAEVMMKRLHATRRQWVAQKTPKCASRS